MGQIFNIIKAWIKVKNKLVNPEIKKRAEICDKCPSARYKRYLDFVDDELKDVQGMVCLECSCPIIAKIRSTDKCPLQKW